MTKLMIDEKTADKLKGFRDPVLLVDPSGVVVGRVVPPSRYDDVAIPFTAKQLQQAENETDEFSLTEILAELAHCVTN